MLITNVNNKTTLLPDSFKPFITPVSKIAAIDNELREKAHSIVIKNNAANSLTLRPDKYFIKGCHDFTNIFLTIITQNKVTI